MNYQCHCCKRSFPEDDLYDDSAGDHVYCIDCIKSIPGLLRELLSELRSNRDKILDYRNAMSQFKGLLEWFNLN